jgi:SsrA-binding protein
MDAVEEELRTFGTEPAGQVRLGAFQSSIHTLVTPAVIRLARRTRTSQIQVLELEPHESLAALRGGDADLIITTTDFVEEPLGPDLDLVPLTTDLIVLVVPPEHPNAGPGPADLAAYADEPWAFDRPQSYMANLTTRLCRQAGFEPMVVGRFSNYSTLLRHVEAGLSVAMLPSLAVDPRYRVATRPLVVPVPRAITAVVRRGAPPRPAISRCWRRSAESNQSTDHLLLSQEGTASCAVRTSGSVGSQVGLSGCRVSGQNHRVKKPETDPVIARNRKAAHDYDLGESWEAGIVLQGAEVKALRAGRASLVGGFAAVEDREIWLHAVHIPQYSQARWFNDGSRRKRKLLLHRAQIDKIERKVNESGLTIVPVTLYFKDGRAKVEIALARGKKTWDKRHALAEREASREAERAVSRRLKGRPD